MTPNSVHSETTKQNPSLEWKNKSEEGGTETESSSASEANKNAGKAQVIGDAIFQSDGWFAEPKLKSKLHNSGISRNMLIYIVLVDFKKT